MGDRRALVRMYAINDQLDAPCILPNAFCMMTCCPHCLIIQELHHVQQVAAGVVPGPPGVGKGTPAMIAPQQQMM